VRELQHVVASNEGDREDIASRHKIEMTAATPARRLDKRLETLSICRLARSRWTRDRTSGDPKRVVRVAGRARVYDLIGASSMALGTSSPSRPCGGFVGRERIFRRVLNGQSARLCASRILST
jgi:hypothetical protein